MVGKHHQKHNCLFYELRYVYIKPAQIKDAVRRLWQLQHCAANLFAMQPAKHTQRKRVLATTEERTMTLYKPAGAGWNGYTTTVEDGISLQWLLCIYINRTFEIMKRLKPCKCGL